MQTDDATCDEVGFSVTAFIPVKPLIHAKSRLKEQLDLARRVELTHDSLRHIVYTLRAVPGVADIVIISRDAQVAAWAACWRVAHLREHRRGLNAALREARAQYAHAAAVLVLPSDLAALSTADVQAIVSAARQADGRCVVIAPDRHGRGTNALLLKPPDVIDFGFGANSALRHARRALARGIQPIWFRSDSICLDLDLPDDLELYLGQW
ncbi:MAG: 2-phospho-L-lactate guanylyltransferase [Thermoflexales bacterium]|nr:2-phospho-L-lactate guanylyltransferase [Thermoflexales bacterium]MDW8351497.1 2-phospho-L-lactate guanylyltransferase [Anaerolineae bacterium]